MKKSLLVALAAAALAGIALTASFAAVAASPSSLGTRWLARSGTSTSGNWSASDLAEALGG